MGARILVLAAACVTLAGCGNGVSVPEQFRGVWSADCPNGQMQLDADQMHILYPQREDFDLTAASFDGKNLTISFESGGKTVTDVYLYDGTNLSADHVILSTGTFNSDKIPMKKCS